MLKKKKHKKKKFVEINKEHLIYVSSLPCCINNRDDDWCRGNVQAHHLLKPFEGSRGFSMKASDKNVVPLCYYHHAMLHDKIVNENVFWTLFGLSEDFGSELAKELWDNSPYKK